MRILKVQWRIQMCMRSGTFLVFFEHCTSVHESCANSDQNFGVPPKPELLSFKMRSSRCMPISLSNDKSSARQRRMSQMPSSSFMITDLTHHQQNDLFRLQSPQGASLCKSLHSLYRHCGCVSQTHSVQKSVLKVYEKCSKNV